MSNPLIYPMAAHLALTAFLYALLTLVRAPAVWGLGRRPDGSNPWAKIEPRISANLSNQFEWPLFFYVVCVLLLQQAASDPIQLWLAWLFIAGRLWHTCVQICTTNVRLRGAVFTINFVAVLAMWLWLLASPWHGA
ncbi:MAPEG family protein [Viridibacterium curvum]|uniref:MAPEG family protein n=1 Tax=Viridibacterium curvum TaxID=1101404 RepID=A0ABP9QGC1_9RHOO